MDKLRLKIINTEKQIKDCSVQIAQASKRRSPDLSDLETKKAKLELSLEKLIKKAEYTTDSEEIPGEVDYDADPNTATQDAPAEDTGDDLDITEETPPNMSDESDDIDMEPEAHGSVADTIMDSIADVIEEKASEGLSVDDLVAALRGGEDSSGAGEEDFAPEDDALDFSEGDDDFSDDEELDFSEGDDFGEDEIVEDGSAPAEALPENEQFKFASLKCKKCGGTNFIKSNNKFACSNCNALMAEMLGLPMEVLELISPKLREENAMGEDAGFEDESMGEPIEEVDESGIEDIDDMDDLGEPEITVVDMEAEPIEEIGEDEFGDDEIEDTDLEAHEESESPMEEEAEHAFDGSESDGEEDADAFDDGSEEHEEDESPEEEEAEHAFGGSEEDVDEESEESEEDEDQNFKEAEVTYKARLKKKANREQTYWLVFGNEVPLFKLSAKYAWEDIDAEPAKDEFPTKFASYYDVFTSVLYRDTIVELCKSAGFKECCARANGRLLKSAQTFSAINNPLQQNGGSENPTPNTNTQTTPGMPDSGTLNPDEESADMFNEDTPNKLLITDMMINYLAPEIANDSYNLDEIMTELKATFSDEAAVSEFEGQLREKADAFGDKKDSEPLSEVNPEMGMDPLAAPTAPAGQSEGAANATEPIQPIKAAEVKKCSKCNKTVCTCKEDSLKAKLAASEKEIKLKEAQLEAEKVKSAEQAEKDHARFRVYQAKNYVEKEMQTRGNLGEPLVPTVEYLMSLGKSAAVAETEANLAIKEAIKTIYEMDDTQFAKYAEIVEKTPKLASRENEESQVKFASIMENASSTPLPYLASAELKTGMDVLFGDEMFTGTKLTELAEKRAQERQQNKRY